MFVLRPSSSFAFIAPQRYVEPAVEAHAIDSGGPFIDEGLPIAEAYQVDIVRAMLQDPFRVFIYWEVREESIKSLTHYFSPKEAAGFRETLRLYELGGHNYAYFDVGRHGRYWMMVFPDREYEFEVGVRSQEHGFIPLARSNRVRTPRGTVSAVTADDGEYQMTPSQFIDVLEASGFGTEQTLDLTVAAMPGVQFFDESPLRLMLAKLPDSVRAAVLLAARGGVLSREMIDSLPEPLRTELYRLLVGADGRLATAGLMHYLPEILREVIEDERELIAGNVHPLHFAPRFFAGGSENAMWPGGEFHLPGRPSSPEFIARR